MKLGDLVRYKTGRLLPHEPFHFPMIECMGILVGCSSLGSANGLRVSYEVQWFEEKTKTWCPQRFLEVAT